MWELSAFIKNATGDPLTVSARLHLASFHSCCMSLDHVTKVKNVMIYMSRWLNHYELSQNKAHLIWTIAFAVEASSL